jgi:hypothetical protein
MVVLVGILTILAVLNGPFTNSLTLARENAQHFFYEFGADPQDATYSIEGNTIRLQDGHSEIAYNSAHHNKKDRHARQNRIRRFKR